MKKAWGDNNTKYRIETDNGPDVEDIVHAHDEIDKEFDSEKLKEMIFHLVGKMPAESVHPILQRKLNELQKPKRFFGLKYPLSSSSASVSRLVDASLTDWHTHWVGTSMDILAVTHL